MLNTMKFFIYESVIVINGRDTKYRWLVSNSCSEAYKGDERILVTGLKIKKKKGSSLYSNCFVGIVFMTLGVWIVLEELTRD